MPKNNQTLIPIKAVIGGTKKPLEILARLNAVLAGAYMDPTDYPNLPVDQATFKSNTDILAADITAAEDGGAKALAARDKQAAVCNKMLHEVGHYVEANCKGDMQTFLKSGFRPLVRTQSASTPLSLYIRAFKQGPVSGQLLLVLIAVLKASAYEVRWMPVGGGQWTTLPPITRIRPATLITGLTPGTNYAFQVRVLLDSGYTDWSDSVTQICM